MYHFWIMGLVGHLGTQRCAATLEMPQDSIRMNSPVCMYATRSTLDRAH